MWNMRKLSFSSKRRNEVKDENKYTESEEENVCIIDWEVRPGGLLVQKRIGVSGEANFVAGPMIKIKVSYDSCYHDLTVPAESTFGDLKKILTDRTGLHPTVQRLLFQGKEKDSNECLHIAGVKDTSKLILMEDPASKEMKKIQDNSVSCEAIAQVKVEVDKLSHRVVTLEEAVLKDGEARTQRKEEVHRIQSLIDMLDNFKARNSNLISNCAGTSLVTTKWETSAPNRLQQSTKITQEWELFD
uniref:BAG family molecular chaperone regulator 4-like isoform X2 n=1 Tax=Nicotiana tabacum TaxID=4097 RepID=A0A1S4BIY0_TOBAC|nr:PREDICTED: BAG family molecular chaperone regulator 4-like isoform X2 [Nicotiana tabacum]